MTARAAGGSTCAARDIMMVQPENLALAMDPALGLVLAPSRAPFKKLLHLSLVGSVVLFTSLRRYRHHKI